MIWYNVSKAGNTDGKEVLSKTLAEIGKMVRGFLFTLYKQIYYKREKWKEAEMELILWLAKSKKNSEKYNVSRELENQLIAGYFTLAFSSLTNFVEQWTYYTTQKTKVLQMLCSTSWDRDRQALLQGDNKNTFQCPLWDQSQSGYLHHLHLQISLPCGNKIRLITNDHIFKKRTTLSSIMILKYEENWNTFILFNISPCINV